MFCQYDLFGKQINSGGNISARCDFSKVGNKCYISIDGIVTYEYDESDIILKRTVLVHIYMKHLGTYKEIAGVTNVSATTIKTWVKRFKVEGHIGLLNKKGQGRKPEISEATKKQALALRKTRKTLREIGRLCSISNVSVLNIINAAKAKNKEKVTDLPGLSVNDENESIPTNTKAINPVSNISSGDILRPQKEEIKLLDDEVEATLSKDRSIDRGSAIVGLLTDAEPLFAPNKNLQFAGMFMAFVLLANDPFLKVGLKIIPCCRSAFYGIRTTLLTLITMALLRLKRPEHLLKNNPESLGLILGLDRVTEVKTMRRKIKELSTAKITEEFMREMAYERSLEYKGDSNIVMVDGHVIGYFGKEKVGSTWSSRDNKVIHGQTENWINLPGKAPLFSLETSFNNGLTSSLEDVLDITKDVLKTDVLTCVFDRGGFSGQLFETLTKKKYGIITYQKGNYPKIDLNLFIQKKINLGKRTYDYLPYEQEINLQINETIYKGECKRPGSKKTGRTIKMRDIRIMCKDGHQISILVNKHVNMTAIEIANTIFDRIGSQENIFKYMRKEFDIDSLVNYSFEEVDADLEHPNPIYTKLEKNNQKLRKKRNVLLAKLGEKIKGVQANKIPEILENFGDSKKAKILTDLNSSIENNKKLLKETNFKENASDAGYKKPIAYSKRFMNVIKIAAYMLETKLFDRLEKHYKYTKNEGRQLIVSALKTNGELKLAPGELIIKLAPQANPRRTMAINALLEELNSLQARFPGSARRIRFEPTTIKKYLEKKSSEK